MPDSQSFAPTKTSPLAGLPTPVGGITLEERPFLGKVNLRGDPGDPGFAEAVSTVVGCTPPSEPNTVATAGEYTVFWLGPDEWQIHCAEDRQFELLQALGKALEGRHAALVDVSDYYVVMRLSGPRVWEVLSKGTPLDLHPRSFQAGACAQTRFSHATVLLHKLEEQTVDLQVRWSFAEFVWSFLVDGSREYLGSGQ